ncbi:hypothetical protein NC651_029144 [Populus alba x Populus x berolinensis]|nr:hypothetical protein NC651_029144 [Populus alba x Populus x berolinensis]
MCPCIVGLFGCGHLWVTYIQVKANPSCAKYTCLSVLGCHDVDGLSSFWFKGIQAFSDSCSCMITIFFYLLLVGSLLGFWGFEENPESFCSFTPIWIEKIVPFLEALCYLWYQRFRFQRIL